MASSTAAPVNARTEPFVRIASRISIPEVWPRSALRVGDLLAHDVEGGAGLEPLDLLGAERLHAFEGHDRAVGLDDLALDVLAGHRGEAEHVDAVVLTDLVVGGRIGEGQRHEALLLQVRLVDAGEAASEDHHTTAEPGLHRSVLSRRALAVVAIADGGPLHAGLAVLLGQVRERVARVVAEVLALADGVVVRVDHAEEQVAGDVLQVAAVRQPLAGGGDVVGGALALGLHQHGQADVVVAVPRRERVEQLQAVAGRRDADLDVAAVGRGRGERVLAGVVAAVGEHFADGGVERDLGAVGSGDRVGGRVEVEAAGERQRDHGVRRGDERQGVGRAVVALGEVAVERVDDRVRLAGDAGRTIPLTDARPAGVGQHGGADRLEVGEETVALDRGPDLLRARGDEQVGLDP